MTPATLTMAQPMYAAQPFHLAVLKHGHGQRGVGVIRCLLLLDFLDLLPQTLLRTSKLPAQG
jgi:hypothetical protein